MGSLRITCAAVLLLGFPASGVAGQPGSGPAAGEPAATTPAPVVMHPGEVALIDEGEKGFVYRHFPTGLRLYSYARDKPGRSLCDARCSTAWPPVVAPADAKPVGKWTIVQRPDGRRQWALLGRPLYVRYHDAPDKATGDGVDGMWRIIGHTRTREDSPFATGDQQVLR
jgi:predicted lipoprotein with Yx(FWY)xxD motif